MDVTLAIYTPSAPVIVIPFPVKLEEMVQSLMLISVNVKDPRVPPWITMPLVPILWTMPWTLTLILIQSNTPFSLTWHTFLKVTPWFLHAPFGI